MMSNKGTIKKTSLVKNKVKADSQTNSQDVVLNDTSNSKNKRKVQSTNNITTSVIKGSEKTQQATSISRVNSLKKRTPDEVRDNRYLKNTQVSKPLKTNHPTSSRSSISNSTLKSTSTTAKETESLKTNKSKSNNVKKMNVSVSRGNETKKEPLKYAEKRGTSVIYMSKSVTNKLDSKTSKRSAKENLTREKEKIKISQSSEDKTLLLGYRERKNSRTLNPSEVKILHPSESVLQILEKPKFKKEIEKGNSNTTKFENEGETEEEYNYEDDFEDYESDFQECTDSDESQIIEVSDESNHSPRQEDPTEISPQQGFSSQNKMIHNTESLTKVEEEHMLDSGHYELSEARKRAAKIESIVATSSALDLPRPTNNKSFRSVRSSENRSLPLSMDEGFEDDSRSGDFVKSPPLSRVSFIDFQKSRNAPSSTKETQKRSSRGKELMEMIKLDPVDISLLECAPIPYEEYIRTYGKLNTRQMATQTSEDNVDCEVQTDEISFSNKWTQFPIQCRKVLRSKEDIQLFQMELVGVGSDDDKTAAKMAEESRKPSFDILRLNDFLNRAGKAVLSLLEQRKFGGDILQSDTQELPFSEGSVKLSINSITFLSGRPVTIVHYSEMSSNVLLTIHSAATDEGIETSNRQDYITDCCIGCVWNIFEPSMPRKLFYAHSPITACCFHPTNDNVVFAGLEDGSINLWDLREDEAWHWTMNDEPSQLNWTMRACTYTTAGNADIGVIHKSEIVSIRVLSKFSEIQFLNSNHMYDFVAIQICSLDEDGCIIIWSVVRNLGNVADDIGLARWGNIRLVKSQEIPLHFKTKKSKNNISRYVDMNVDSMDNNNLYVATNTSNVLHVTCIGNKTNPLMYKQNEVDSCGATTCIETCPFEQSYFFVGCDDGTIRLHTLNTERPLLQLKDGSCKDKIKLICWSKSMPFVIYALDDNSQVHVWNFGKSDVRPIHTLSTRKWAHVNSMKLSTWKNERDMPYQYLALGSETGHVRIHKLKTDYHYSKKDDFLEEMALFTRYASIL